MSSQGIRFACPHADCSYSATQKSNLGIHVALVHSDTRIPRPVAGCDYVAKLKSHLNSHTRKKHGFGPTDRSKRGKKRIALALKVAQDELEKEEMDAPAVGHLEEDVA